jgi:hypothetical protein
MEKLDLYQMSNVLGGAQDDARCGAVQAAANAMARDGATDKQWEEWEKLYHQYC